MIRLATRADLGRIFEIRNSVDENRLSDPGAVTETHVAWFVDNAALWVWQEADGLVIGFSGSDPRDGSIWALFVAPSHEGKGIGRALLKTACDALRAAGWTDAGRNDKGELILRKALQ